MRPTRPSSRSVGSSPGASSPASRIPGWRFVQRFAWTPAERCALVAAVAVPYVTAYWLSGEYLRHHPEVAPYVDFGFLPTHQRIALAILLAWALLLASALALRKRKPQSRVLVHTTVQLYSVSSALAAFVAGPVTSPNGLLLVGGMMLGMVLFDRRAVLYGMATGVAVLIGTALLVRAGMLRYAPLLSRPTQVGGWWSGMMTAVLISVGVANLVLFAYVVARLRDRERLLLESSRTDHLTGIGNRRHFLEVFERELERARRYGTPLACAIFDLDHFKRVNDQYGHLAGDRVLVATTDIFRRCIRANDFLARFGGEEFVLLLPQTDLEGARAVAERCRSELEAATIRIPGGSVRMTVSVGLACGTGGDLLAAADAAVYRAKADGRNRLVCAG